MFEEPNEYVETQSGKRVWLLDTKPESIDISDIAWSLAKIQRFVGHGSFTNYSVAEHCIKAADMLRDRGYDAGFQLWALLHDAHEAYIGDISRPLKKLLNSEVLRKIESSLDLAILNAVGFSPTPEQMAVVRRADDVMLATEAHRMMFSQGKHYEIQAMPDMSIHLEALDVNEACMRYGHWFNNLLGEWKELQEKSQAKNAGLPH